MRCARPPSNGTNSNQISSESLLIAVNNAGFAEMPGCWLPCRSIDGHLRGIDRFDLLTPCLTVSRQDLSFMVLHSHRTDKPFEICGAAVQDAIDVPLNTAASNGKAELTAAGFGCTDRIRPCAANEWPVFESVSHLEDAQHATRDFLPASTGV